MSNRYDLSLFILRVILGFTFFVHGYDKFANGIGNIAGWFGSIGLPEFLAYGVALLEIIGGIALVIGLGTRIISALFVLLMIGATLKVKLAVGFLGNGQMAGYELDLALMAMSAALLLNGSGKYAVDHALFSSKKAGLNKVA